MEMSPFYAEGDRQLDSVTLSLSPTNLHSKIAQKGSDYG
jgi:hypothetical protein